MNEAEHIVLICSRLDQPGGTEKACVTLANLFAKNGHRVTIIIADETDAMFYETVDEVRVIWLNLHFGIGVKGNAITRKLALWQHIRQLRKTIVNLKPAIVIGSEYHLSIAGWLAAHKLPSTKILAWENHHIHWLKKNWFWQRLFSTIYPRLDGVVCQNTREKELYEAMGCKAFVIPYSIPTQQQRSKLQTKNILTIGWLIPRKGVDLIPAIAEKVFSSHPDWHWKIIGRGELKTFLQREISERNLEGQLEIQEPSTSDLQSTYLDTSIYVMTSRFECLPLVLLEALSYGIPPVAFDCPTGPADIIQHNSNGFLLQMEDVDGMADAICDLIADKAKRERIAENAFESSERYMPGRVYGEWRLFFGEW